MVPDGLFIKPFHTHYLISSPQQAYEVGSQGEDKYSERFSDFSMITQICE